MATVIVGNILGGLVLRALGMDPATAYVTRMRLDIDLHEPVRMTVEMERFVTAGEANELVRVLEDYELVKR